MDHLSREPESIDLLRGLLKHIELELCELRSFYESSAYEWYEICKITHTFRNWCTKLTGTTRGRGRPLKMSSIVRICLKSSCIYRRPFKSSSIMIRPTKSSSWKKTSCKVIYRQKTSQEILWIGDLTKGSLWTVALPRGASKTDDFLRENFYESSINKGFLQWSC